MKKSAAPRIRTTSRGGGKVGKAELPSDALTEVIGRALTDTEFRSQLFSDRARATRGLKLTKSDRSALDRITPEILEEHANRLGGRASLTVKVVISKSF